MLIDGALDFDATDIADQGAQFEDQGYDGAWSAETGHDPLIVLSRAADRTSTLELGTSILVAFGRTPMVTATMANDVQLLSRGRLLLGLGSQIKPHIEKRYSMPWSHPAPRMREYVLALRAIWACWNEGAPLQFRGEFYRHTLMTPFFNPGPNPFGAPKVFIAAVGELMTEVAGEVADGLLVHPFTTERYLKEITLPALERGFAKSGKSRDDFQISLSGLVATGDTEASSSDAAEKVREQVAFYGSTPAYRQVLDLHGWGDVQPRLNELSRAGDWKMMAGLVSDEMLNAFAVVGEPSAIADAVKNRFTGSIDRFGLYTPYALEDESRHLIVTDLLN